jgi:ABC-type uncharacterized transport system permease subunit
MIPIALFGIVGGSVATLFLLHETNLRRILLSLACGLLASSAAGCLFEFVFYRELTVPDEAIIGGVLGPAVAIFMAQRAYGGQNRDPNDLRGS